MYRDRACTVPGVQLFIVLLIWKWLGNVLLNRALVRLLVMCVCVVLCIEVRYIC